MLLQDVQLATLKTKTWKEDGAGEIAWPDSSWKLEKVGTEVLLVSVYPFGTILSVPKRLPPVFNVPVIMALDDDVPFTEKFTDVVPGTNTTKYAFRFPVVTFPLSLSVNVGRPLGTCKFPTVVEDMQVKGELQLSISGSVVVAWLPPLPAVWLPTFGDVS